MADDRLEDIVARTEPRLLALLEGALGNGEDAADVCQETWPSLATARVLPRGRDPWPLVRTTDVRRAIDRIRVLLGHGEDRAMTTATPVIVDAPDPAVVSSLLADLQGLRDVSDSSHSIAHTTIRHRRDAPPSVTSIQYHRSHAGLDLNSNRSLDR